MAKRSAAKKKSAMNRRKQNKLAVVTISLVVMMLMCVIAVNGVGLMQKQKAYTAQEADLQVQIDAENKRTAELREFEKYTKTTKYAEDVAKEKLGLVNGDEIVFKPDDGK